VTISTSWVMPVIGYKENKDDDDEPQDFVIFNVHELPASICGIVFVQTQCA